MNMIYIIKHILQSIGYIFSFLNIQIVNHSLRWIQMQFYVGYKKRLFHSFGCSTIYPFSTRIYGGEYIDIGDNSELSKGMTITAFCKHNNQLFHPHISIGNNVSIGENAHITACGIIKIGDGVLTGKNILITDNSHGFLNQIKELNIKPLDRDLKVKGNIIIGDNVWIGSGAVILSNVKIGCGSVIAANSVVTSDIPAYSVAAGVPAKIVKQVNK